MRQKTVLSCVVLLALSFGAFAQNSAKTQVLSSSEPVVNSNGPVVAGFGNKPSTTGTPQEMAIYKEVRHELLMLPYYSLFDDLEFSVQGRTVTLEGYLTSVNSQTKVSAENAVKRIEGVEKVVDNIKILPPSPFDQQIRERLYRKLVNTGGLSRYFWEAAPSIHIIVQNQNVTLKGYVQSAGDKNLAGMAAKQMSQVFAVKNELQVLK